MFVLAAWLWASGASGLELRGVIEPAPRRPAVVVLYGTASPYTASTLSDSKGRFRFRKLAAGGYTVVVYAHGEGDTRKTVGVTPSLADKRGVVQVAVSLPGLSRKTLKRHYGVTARELSIPDEAMREYRQARRDLRKPDTEAAFRHFEKAVEIAPQFAEAWNYMGVMSYQAGKYQDAEKYFRQALEASPGFYDSLVNLGGVLLNLKRYEEAFPYNQHAVLERPEDALAQSQLGLNHFLLGRMEPAIEHLTKAKKLDPAHFSRPQIVLAEIYARRHDNLAAVRELREFLKLHPDAPEAGRVRKSIEKLESTPNPK